MVFPGVTEILGQGLACHNRCKTKNADWRGYEEQITQPHVNLTATSLEAVILRLYIYTYFLLLKIFFKRVCFGHVACGILVL